MIGSTSSLAFRSLLKSATGRAGLNRPVRHLSGLTPQALALHAAAVAQDHPVVVVCGADQLRDVDIPANVEVRREIPWEEYLSLLRGAGVVVVPLSTELVPSGQVAILEAMKMENELRAASAGVVTAIHAVPGTAIDKGMVLVEIGVE